jgi:HEAT repeat protein
MAYLGAADINYREHVTKFLLQKMKKSNTLYEPWCGLGLGVMSFMLSNQGESIPAAVHEATLDKFNKTSSPGRKSAYAIALGLMKNESAKGDIRKSLGDVRDSEFRGYASIGLGLLNAREHMGYLGEIVDDSKRDPDLLKQSSIGLGLMKDRNAVTRLLDYLTPEKGRAPRIAVLSAVATALGFIGDKSCVQPLIDTMGNSRLSDLGRAFAAVSLGMVADKDTMPWNSAFGENLNYRAAVSTLIDQNTGTGILDIL